MTFWDFSLVELIAAAAALYAAIGVHQLQRRFDRLDGRVNAVETAHNAHVNTPGLHGHR